MGRVNLFYCAFERLLKAILLRWRVRPTGGNVGWNAIVGRAGEDG
jgi:hypothetical protein